MYSIESPPKFLDKRLKKKTSVPLKIFAFHQLIKLCQMNALLKFK
jgi:hypothetical protein